MGVLLFKAADNVEAKKIVDFWNPYCKGINEFSGNGRDYYIHYDGNYEITDYKCGQAPKESITCTFYGNNLPEFMSFPKNIRDKMVERSEAFSPVPFIIDITSSSSNGGFTWRDSPEGQEFWYSVIKERDFILFNNRFKIKEHESRLSEQESPLRGCSGDNTSRVCCRKHQARVTIITPGYQEVIGRG